MEFAEHDACTKNAGDIIYLVSCDNWALEPGETGDETLGLTFCRDAERIYQAAGSATGPEKKRKEVQRSAKKRSENSDCAETLQVLDFVLKTPAKDILQDNSMKKVEVVINGMGRIGRTLFRLMSAHPEFVIKGVNDPMGTETIAHLLKYDTVRGTFSHPVFCNGDMLVAGGREIPVTHYESPLLVPPGGFGADILIESSGRNPAGELGYFLEAGARAVILSCPSRERVDRTVVLGVNEHELSADDRVVSNASCTANCICPLLNIIDKAVGVESAFLNTVHPYTNSQNLVDSAHNDLRRARAAGANIIPTETSAIQATKEVLPWLKNSFDGVSTRVPIVGGALADLVVVLKNKFSASELNEIVRESAESSMKGIIQYVEDPIVSSDIIGNSHSCIFDSLLTKVINGDKAQLISWYDNEYGFSCRVADLALLMGKRLSGV